MYEIYVSNMCANEKKNFFSNCDFCVTTDACGFCHDENTKKGFCLPASSNPEDFSSTGSCAQSNGSYK